MNYPQRDLIPETIGGENGQPVTEKKTRKTKSYKTISEYQQSEVDKLTWLAIKITAIGTVGWTAFAITLALYLNK